MGGSRALLKKDFVVRPKSKLHVPMRFLDSLEPLLSLLASAICPAERTQHAHPSGRKHYLSPRECHGHRLLQLPCPGSCPFPGGSRPACLLACPPHPCCLPAALLPADSSTLTTFSSRELLSLPQATGVPGQHILVAVLPGLPTAAELFVLPYQDLTRENKRSAEDLEQVSPPGDIQLAQKSEPRPCWYLSPQHGSCEGTWLEGEGAGCLWSSVSHP